MSSIHQRNENKAGNNGTKTTDSLVSSKFLLNLDGFVYHPRFIQYVAKGAVGLYDEHYHSNIENSFSGTAATNDYELRAKVLPEHPYNIELYTLSQTPYFRQTTAQTRATNTERGAILNYADRPFYLNASYTAGEDRSRVYSSEYWARKAWGSYLIGPVSNSVSYAHNISSGSLSMYTASDQAIYENRIDFSNIWLDSKYTVDRSKQDSLFAAGFAKKETLWEEQFNARLPWNFFTTASYRALKTSLKSEAQSSAVAQDNVTKTRTSDFSLAHKIYDSVRTTYVRINTATDTSTGDIRGETDSAFGVYTKKIPAQGRLTVSAQGSHSITKQDNAPLVIGETQNAALYGFFTLSRTDIDLATILVKVLFDDGTEFDLAQNVHYFIEQPGNAVKITMLSLPAQIIAEGHTINFPYTFRITYKLLANTVKLRTASLGYDIHLSLYDNLVTPYYSYMRTEQAVLAGSIPGGAQDSELVVLGVSLVKAPYLWVTEQRTMDSRTNPSRSLRNTMEYSDRLSDTVSLNARAEHITTVYGRGIQDTGGYTERLMNLNCMLMQNVPRQHLNASISFSYSKKDSTFESDLYAVLAGLAWKIGLLSVDLGASLNRVESSTTIGRQQQMSEYYYLTLKRRLF